MQSTEGCLWGLPPFNKITLHALEAGGASTPQFKEKKLNKTNHFLTISEIFILKCLYLINLPVPLHNRPPVPDLFPR